MALHASEVQTLRGWRGRPLALRWLAPGPQEAKEVAILWPGLRYSPERPLLARPARWLQERGVAVAQVEADYRTPGFQQADPALRWRWLVGEALTVLQAVRQRRAPQGLFWIGKSLGTLAMAGAWLEGQGTDLRASLWLTPLLTFPAVVKVLAHLDTPALVVGSLEDPTFDQQGWQAVAQNPQVAGWLLQRGNHSLEVPHDPAATRANLEQVGEKVEAFFAEVLAQEG